MREWGDPAGWPIVFVHGLAQSHLSFLPQFASPLADRYRLIAYDLRGHGESAKPLDPSFYNEGRRWADELEAVIDGMDATKPILVGWSLGGRVRPPVPDALRRSSHRRAQFRLVRAPSKIRRCSPRHRAPTSPAVRTRWPSASTRTSHSCARASFASRRKHEFAVALAYNVIVPQEIREAISGWSTGLEETRAALAKVTVPTLVTHGRDDALILPAAAEMTAAAIKGARISWYDDCGHSPFVEHAERFNRELDEFATAIQAQHVGEHRA